MTVVPSVDPRTGAVAEMVATETTQGGVHDACAAAERAFPTLRDAHRADRATLLRAIARRLGEERGVLVGIADRETALGLDRLTGELARTCWQLEHFAEVLVEGSYLEATLDPAGDTPAGPRPDLRRMLVPVGPVAVFGASNFPLAFGVPGGDTVSAIAAGCPVVAKAHPSHPATSRLAYSMLEDVAAAHGFPVGTIGLVYGQAAGATLVTDAAIRAVGFTGSCCAGRVLSDIVAARPDPIPFYGELGSLNPVVVTPSAATERPERIADAFVASMTLGAGQLCTKPGLLFVPSGTAGDRLRTALARAMARTTAGVMLNRAIHDAYQASRFMLLEHPDTTPLGTTATGENPPAGLAAWPLLVRVAATDLDSVLLAEHFGPAGVVVEYADTGELLDTLSRLEGQLAAAVHAAGQETELPLRLRAVLLARVGRLVWNAFPTGVAVAWAMQHGGPWPSTTHAGYTSVGATAIRRWLRPVTFQDSPQWMLPPELRDGNPEGIPRRVDGRLHPPSAV